MRIGVFSTRLAGTDGVSLETAKWAQVLERMGHQVLYCAGELDESSRPGLCIEQMHFRHEAAMAVGERAFGGSGADPSLLDDIAQLAAPLTERMLEFVADESIEWLIVENAQAIPMQLPLGQALAELIERTGLPTIAHHHDFYWERQRFATKRMGEWLDRYFPFHAPNVRHAVIHSGARRDLARRRGLSATVVPNVFDFAAEPPGLDDYNADFRSAVGLSEQNLLVLQPTRVVERKGIELAIELLARLGRSDAALVITHEAGDEGMGYLRRLEALAHRHGVDLRYVPQLIGPRRGRRADGTKIYSLWDAYPHADLVTYPSLYEGFGNALLEAIFFRCPVLVNRYSVYAADIGPKGFDLVEIDGEITDDAVAAVARLLGDEAHRRRAADQNVQVAQEHFSYEVLSQKLSALLSAG